MCYTECAKIPDKYWDVNSPGFEGILRSKNYFAAIEKILKQQGIQSYYVCAKQLNHVPVLFQFHVYNISLWELLGGTKIPSTFFAKLGSVLLARPRLRLVICGNLLISGAPGIGLTPDSDIGQYTSLMEEVTRFMQKKFRFGIGFILFKDLNNQLSQLFDSDNLPENCQYRFTQIPMAPVMTLKVDPDWNNLNDYTDALKSKYRSRLLDCREKIQALIKKTLSPEQLNQYKTEINVLYANIYNKAKAKGPYLGTSYFSAVSNALTDKQFNVVGYFNGHQLVAINSRFMHENTLISSFFGIATEDNEKYALFKNLLFDDLEYAILNKATAVNYGRTTYDLKSAVGAIPVTLNAAVTPLNRISGLLMSIVKIMLKQNPWRSRCPFRQKNTG